MKFFTKPQKEEPARLPKRPTREHVKQFSTALTSISYVQYAEFKRYADAIEAQLSQAEASLAAAQKEIDKEKGRRTHTQEWYASHYGRLEDWARKVLPEPWRNQFFSCIANGTYDGMLDVGEPYMCKAGFMVTPSGYIRMNDARGQIIRDQTSRAELAESKLSEAQKEVTEYKAGLYEANRRFDIYDKERAEALQTIKVLAEEIRGLKS